MKVRQGFVSNSSSSSFIAMVKNREHCKDELLKRIGFEALFVCKKYRGGDTELYCSSFDELIQKLDDKIYETKKQLDDVYGEELKKCYKKQLEDLVCSKESVLKDIEKIQNGDYDVYYFELSNHEKLIRAEIDILIENGDMVVISQEFM